MLIFTVWKLPVSSELAISASGLIGESGEPVDTIKNVLLVCIEGYCQRFAWLQV